MAHAAHLLALVGLYLFAAAFVLLVVANVIGQLRMVIWRRKHRQVLSDRWMAGHLSERRPWW